jgi:hypothetical protein
MKPQLERKRARLTKPESTAPDLKAPDLPPQTPADLDRPPNAARVMQENLEKMRAEAAERAKDKQVAEEWRLSREEADKEEARRQEDAFVRGIEDVPTREALLEHIRRMRAPPPAPPAPPPLSEAARKRLEEEQEAGRRAAAAQQARGR